MGLLGLEAWEGSQLGMVPFEMNYLGKRDIVTSM